MTDFNKEYNKKNKVSQFRKTLRKYTEIHCFNDKYQFSFLIIPLALFYIPYDMLKSYLYSKMTWNETKATKVLDKTLPKLVEKDDDCFWYNTGWSSWAIEKRAPWYYKFWVSKFTWNLHRFIKDGYENENYIKTIESDWDSYWVKFTPKKNE